MHERISYRDDRASLPLDLASLILPQTVRLETVSVRRELSIEDAIRNEERDPRDRLGLAGERVVSLLLGGLTQLDPHRLLCWDTVVQRRNVIEIDGVSPQGRVFLEIKWTVNPERVFATCARQLLNASEIYQLSGHTAPRGIGIVIDCGPLVGKPAYHESATVVKLVQMIESGTEPFALCVLPYEEIVDCIRLSPYADLLSSDGVRAALK